MQLPCRLSAAETTAPPTTTMTSDTKMRRSQMLFWIFIPSPSQTKCNRHSWNILVIMFVCNRLNSLDGSLFISHCLPPPASLLLPFLCLPKYKLPNLFAVHIFTVQRHILVQTNWNLTCSALCSNNFYILQISRRLKMFTDPNRLGNSITVTLRMQSIENKFGLIEFIAMFQRDIS